MNNPSLRQEPRHRPAAVIPLQQEASILGWLERTGRLLARDNQDDFFLEEEEITELMGVDDSMYDDIDDDDDDVLIDEE